MKKKSRAIKRKKLSGRERISDELIADVCTRLAKGSRVRRTLPEKGRLHIDRQLPFLCVYRQPVDQADEGTEKTIEGEAAYLVAPGRGTHHARVAKLVEGIVKTVSPQFGGLLLLEVWAGDEGTRASDPARPEESPKIRVFASDSAAMDRTIDALVRALLSIKVMKQPIEVDLVRPGRTVPPGNKPLISRSVCGECHCETIGIELPPVYRSVARDQRFPLLLRTFRHHLAIALHKTFFAFSRSQTTHRPPHFHELGRRAVVKAVWQVDRQLSEVGSQFDYLLNVTPINTSQAWNEFKRRKFKRAPEFHYAPLPFDPTLLKRQLFAIPLERIEDAALYNLFLEKQEELDRKISMLRDRSTERFKYGSLELFGGVTDELHAVALEILARPGKAIRSTARKLTAEQFATRAEAEIAWYREVDPTFTPKVELTRKVAGMMVSRGKLLVSPEMSFSEGRVDPLIQHEIGTHLVTWHNGAAQPFRQLKAGLAGYEELQEGFAVLSEYLVDGLSRLRLRQLAGRVVAVRCLLNGESFVETFQQLHDAHGFSKKMAYTVTMRVFRGGGLTKDAVYLRGLLAVLAYVRTGGDLKPLLVGKIAAAHIPMILELQFRRVLVPPPLTPRFMQSQSAQERLARLVESDIKVTDLVTANLG
ncbi:MAG: DUF1704 domain-containing protein [Planctomycetota bacterium]|nr:DUF1704 domain-containing protein [Planctomycetota bacterium]MDA1252004.1 DUF1704 domain-containing protein [Planctomycetota bacterium]